MTNYPQDEFDQVPESSDRQGVHRSKMAEPKARGLGMIILASGLALAIGVLSFFVLPLLGAGGPAESVAASEPTTAAAATSAAAETASPAAPSATATKQPEAAGTTAAAEETKTKSAEPEDTGDAAADQDTPVLVLNGTGTAGLGADVSATLTANGWQVAGADNWTGSNLANSVIFYNPGQEAKAQELSKLMNIGDVRRTGQGEISDGLTVVLGPGFE